MRFLFVLLMLAMPAVALAQDVPAPPKLLPGTSASGVEFAIGFDTANNTLGSKRHHFIRNHYFA